MPYTKNQIDAYMSHLSGLGSYSPEEIKSYSDHLHKISGIPTETETSGAEAAIQGFGSFGTAGYLPALQTGAGKAAKLLSEGLETVSGGKLSLDPQFALNKELSEKGFIVKDDKDWSPNIMEMQEREKKLKEEHPGAYYTGGVLGGIATTPIYGAGLKAIGLGSKGVQARGLVEGAKQGIKEGAKQGAVLGLLSQPEISSQEYEQGLTSDTLMSQTGKRLMGGAFGAGFGGLLGGVAGGLSGKFGKKAPTTVESDGAPPEGPSAVIPEEEIPANKTFAQKKVDESITPETVEDIKAQTKKMKESGPLKGETVSQKRVDQIITDNPDLPKPIPGYHKKMLSSDSDKDVLRTLAESPGDLGETIRGYEQEMKSAAQGEVKKILQTSGGRPPVDPEQSGQSVMELVSGKHQQVKEQLAPIFDQFKNIRVAKQKYLPLLREKLVENLPELNEFLTIGKYGQLTLDPYRMTSKMTKEGHAIMGQLINELNSPSLSFSEMQSIREALRKSLPYDHPDLSTVHKARKSMLDYMEGLINSYKPKSDVVGTFKQYAINEKNLDNFQKIIGGKIDDFDRLITASPEKVLDRIFSSINNIKTSREIIGKDQFKQYAADHLNKLISSAIDESKGTLSSQKMYSILKKNASILKESLDPKTYKRLLDLADYMRMIPDTPSVNPSGTAKVSEIIGQLMGGRWISAGKESLGLLKQARAQTKAINEMNKLMKAKSQDQLTPRIVGTGPSGLLGSQAGREMLR
jgi:hypothetical protein